MDLGASGHEIMDALYFLFTYEYCQKHSGFQLRLPYKMHNHDSGYGFDGGTHSHSPQEPGSQKDCRKYEVELHRFPRLKAAAFF
jgi:hypothetical protein